MRGSVLAIAALVLCACAPLTPTSPATTASSGGAAPSVDAIPLSIANGTTISVDLVVNGVVIATMRPGAQTDVPTASFPPRPWAIETRSPSGRVLSALSVSTTDYYDRFSGRAVRVDLSCGRLDVWLGPPMLGPAFVPGPSGDCA